MLDYPRCGEPTWSSALLQVKHSCMHCLPLLESRPQGLVQPVFSTALRARKPRARKGLRREGQVAEGASRSSVRLVVTSWSKRTWCGAIAAHCFWT